MFEVPPGDAAAVAARSALWQLAVANSANESGTLVLSSCSHRCEEPSAGAAVVHRPVEILMAATMATDASEDYQDSVAVSSSGDKDVANCKLKVILIIL